MNAKTNKTRIIEKSQYRIYLDKAFEFHEMMLKARENGFWTAAGLNAVHCAISSADALLVFHLGLRSVGDDHVAVVDLLTRLPFEAKREETNAFRRIIAKKNVIAYENREFRQTDALEISKSAERFYAWTKKNLPE